MRHFVISLLLLENKLRNVYALIMYFWYDVEFILYSTKHYLTDHSLEHLSFMLFSLIFIFSQSYIKQDIRGFIFFI